MAHLHLLAAAGLVLAGTFRSTAVQAPILIGYDEVAKVGDYSQATMDRIGQTRWFFAHASVGGGFCEGVWRDNFYDSSFYELTRYPCASNPPPTVAPGAVCEIGRGNPGWPLKIEWFSNYLAAGWCYPTVDYSMNKLGSVDPDADWQAYVNSYLQLEAMYPATTLIYMTIPLTTNEDSDNVLRNNFNNNLRTWVKANGRILLDDADIEAHDTNGVQYTFTTNGVVYQKLWDGYSTDGSHPNIVYGQNWLGKMFYATASAILNQRGPYIQAKPITAPVTRVSINWASLTNEVYTLVKSTNVTGPWQSVAANISATPPTNNYPDLNAPGQTWFYDVSVVSNGVAIDRHPSMSINTHPDTAPAVQLNWTCHSNETFSVEGTLDSSGNWQTLVSNVVATPPWTSYTSRPDSGCAYFRVIRTGN